MGNTLQLYMLDPNPQVHDLPPRGQHKRFPISPNCSEKQDKPVSATEIHLHPRQSEGWALSAFPNGLTARVVRARQLGQLGWLKWFWAQPHALRSAHVARALGEFEMTEVYSAPVVPGLPVWPRYGGVGLHLA